jgi:hypothetical protein
LIPISAGPPALAGGCNRAERFFITDINNPGASAKAQSEMGVFFDEFSTDIPEFNHSPGGAPVKISDVIEKPK